MGGGRRGERPVAPQASAEELRRLRGCLAAAEADSVAARQQLAAARAEGDARRREQLQAAEVPADPPCQLRLSR